MPALRPVRMSWIDQRHALVLAFDTMHQGVPLGECSINAAEAALKERHGCEFFIGRIDVFTPVPFIDWPREWKQEHPLVSRIR